jgi:hypothetical protein
VVDEQIAHAEATWGRTIERVVVLGDFGMFGPNLHDHFRRAGRRFSRPVSFLEGNHEDYCNLDRLVRDYADVVTHLPRGSVHPGGGGRMLCIGGARYMDAWSTPPGCEISDRDVARCLALDPGSVDLVVSHDCPAGLGVEHEPGLEHLGPPGDHGLARIADHLRPRLWVFGHHHRWHECEAAGTRYLGLPQSWQGYAIVDPRGALHRVENEVALPGRPGWLRWIGLK